MNRVLALLAVLALFLAGCGNKSKTVTETGANGQSTTRSVPDVHFAKTKFLLHSGLAFGAIRRYIFKPARAGTFRKGAPGRKKAIAKAALAGAFAVHELKQAQRAALSDNQLRPLADKVTGLGSKLSGLVGGLKGGLLNPASLTGVAGAVTGLGKASQGAGAPIKERAVPSF